jgi:hypothetical protein
MSPNQEEPAMSIKHPAFAALMTTLTLCAAAVAQKGKPDEPPPAKPIERPTMTLRLTGPYTHDNLTIFLIHGDDQMKGRKLLTLDEALEQKKVVVHETKEVNKLAIENTSDEEVFIQAGDIVKGGQQDRIIAIDVIVPPKSGKLPLESFCVEAGRWAAREGEAVEQFGSSKNAIPNAGLKGAARAARSQRGVWDNVARAQAKLSANVGDNVKSAKSESSLQLTLEHKKLVETVAAYEKALKDCASGKEKSDVIGLVIAVNGKMNSGDVYASHDLFLKLWPKLLQASAVEAVTELQKDKKFDPATLDAAKAWLADAEKGKRSDADVNKRLTEVRQESEKILLFETLDRDLKGACLRRSYVTK